MASSTSMTAGASAAAIAAPSDPKPESQKLLWDDETIASRYRKAEGFTGEHAHDLLSQMGLTRSTPTPVTFLDLACGTGVVSKIAISSLGLDEKHDEKSTVADSHAETQVDTRYNFTTADLAPAMLDVLRSRIETEHWPVRPTVVQADMRDTKLPVDSFTHLACNFGPCNAPTPLATLRESYRLLRPGGIAGWTAWMLCGWYPDLKAAIDEIRSAAQTACADVKRQGGTAEDDAEEKLAKMPELMDFEAAIGRFAGLNDLSTERDEDGEVPKWHDDGYFAKQVRKVGFADVKVSIVRKTMEMSVQDAMQSLLPILKIFGTWWSDEERKVMDGGLLEARLTKWFQQRAERAASDKVVWDDWKAMVVTGKKQ